VIVKNSLQVGSIYESIISFSLYTIDESSAITWLKNINRQSSFMVLENGFSDRFTKIITQDGEVGYIDSTFHYAGSETMKKIL